MFAAKRLISQPWAAVLDLDTTSSTPTTDFALREGVLLAVPSRKSLHAIWGTLGLDI